MYEPSTLFARKQYTVDEESPVSVTVCDVPLVVPVTALPYDDVVPYSTTDVPLEKEVVQVMTVDVEPIEMTMLDIAEELVVKVLSVL